MKIEPGKLVKISHLLSTFYSFCHHLHLHNFWIGFAAWTSTISVPTNVIKMLWYQNIYLKLLYECHAYCTCKPPAITSLFNWFIGGKTRCNLLFLPFAVLKACYCCTCTCKYNACRMHVDSCGCMTRYKNIFWTKSSRSEATLWLGMIKWAEFVSAWSHICN